jgi:hypothetical protein
MYCTCARVTVFADEAYHAACAALWPGLPDTALPSMRVALESCLPEKATAVAKVCTGSNRAAGNKICYRSLTVFRRA